MSHTVDRSIPIDGGDARATTGRRDAGAASASRDATRARARARRTSARRRRRLARDRPERTRARAVNGWESAGGVNWPRVMGKETSAETWRTATPARVRGPDASTSGRTVAVGGLRTFEDDRVKDFRDEQRARGVYAPPSEDEARANANATHPRVLTASGGLRKFGYFEADVDLGLEFGAGVNGYFFSLKALAILFFVAFAMNLPAMFGYYTSTYYASKFEAEPDVFGYPPDVSDPNRPDPTYSSWYVTWHWANPMSASLGTVAPDSVPQRAWVLAGASTKVMRWSSSKVDFIRMAVALDVSTCVIMLIIVCAAHLWLVAMERRIERGTASLKDYSVMVVGLPTDASEEEVRCFFAMRYGPVARVTVVKTECMHVRAQRKRLKLLEDYDEAEAALIAAGNRGGDASKKRIEASIMRIDRTLARRKARTRARASCAFVTFEDERSKITCLLHNTRSLVSYIFAFPRKDRFRGKCRYAVKQAPEPEDVRYENLNLKNRFWRRLFTAVICAGVVCLCYGFLKLLVDDKEKIWDKVTMYQHHLAKDVGIVIAHGDADEKFTTHQNQFKTACEAQLDACGLAFSKPRMYVGAPWGAPLSVFYDYPNATMKDREYAQLNTVRDMIQCADDDSRCPAGAVPSCYACYCASLRYGLPRPIVRPYSKAIRQTCERYQNLGPGEYYNWLWTSFVITLMNVGLEWVAPFLVAGERLRSLSATKVLTTKIIFFARYLNVAVIYALLNANFAQAGKYFPLVKQMFGLKGEYYDFTNDWYNDVGLVIFFCVLMSVTVRFLGRALSDMIVQVRKKFATSYCHTQKKLNEAFEGPEFDTGAKVGDMCFTIMAAMSYSSGMPLLYLVLAMYFVLVYVYDYRFLLKVCKTPERTSTKLAKTMMQVMFVSIIIHCLVGLWMYSTHWTPDLLHKKQPFESSLVNQHAPLERYIGGSELNPPHDAFALTETILDTGSATAYFHRYRDATVGSVLPEQHVKPPPRVYLRFSERPFSEAAMPFLGFGFALTGCGILWAVISALIRCGKKRSNITRSWKQLPNFQVAIMTGLLVGSETYDPEEQPEYMFMFERKRALAAAAARAKAAQEDGPDRGDSVNSQDDWDAVGKDGHTVAPYALGYDPSKEYDGGAPWMRKSASSKPLYGGDEATAKRGSRGTHQRDGGHYGLPVVDVRALGVGNDYNHTENDSFVLDEDVAAADLEYSGSDADTLRDDGSTERSASESEEDDDDARGLREPDRGDNKRPAWLH